MLDLLLIGTQVHDEHQCVVVLDLLHGRLSGEWVLYDAIVVQLGPAGNALARVLGAPLALEGLGPVKVDGGAHLGLDFGVRPLQHRLLGFEGLGLSLRDLAYGGKHLASHPQGGRARATRLAEQSLHLLDLSLLELPYDCPS